MKREHAHPSLPSLPPDSISGNIPGCSGGVSINSKDKMAACWDDGTLANDDAGVDELLAMLGYNVKSSDLADVAQKLQQLEEVMGNANKDGAVLSQLASESVHYNPSDISNCLENMLTELNPTQPHVDSLLLPPYPESSSSVHAFHPETPPSEFYFLKAIPGHQVLNESNKRLKQSFQPFQNNVVVSSSSRPVVLIDTQESGIRLVHTLMACAEAIQQEKLPLAQTLVNQVGVLAASQAGAMKKVVTYFHEALSRRIYGFFPQEPIDPSLSDLLQMHFYETCPYFKFAHFTANQAILEAFSGKKRVHVIDFSMNQGMQWPALMQALAVRPGGPPAFRLTAICPPSPDKTDRFQEVGWKLAQFAESIHVEFEYRGFVANTLADLDASMLELRPSEVEAVAVNSIFELHRVLALPGAIEKVLQVVKEMKPEIITVVEQEANHNGPYFLDRFTESLHYYSTLFDSLEGSVSQQDKVMSEVYLGRQICNVVACEGPDRLERHETLGQWRTRFATAGYAPQHLGSNVYRQACMLLALSAGEDGYGVEENDGCLMLGWHTRPLIATSAWKIGGAH